MRKGASAISQFNEAAERCEWVEITLKDGRTYEGNVIRNPIRRTGTVVNAITESRHDFSYDEILAIRKVIDPRNASLS